MSLTENSYKVPSETRIGHIHLKVSDLNKSLDFYSRLLGFEVVNSYGKDAVFLSAGGYHHHIGINIWYSKNAPPAPVNTSGLFHFAIQYPSRKDLAEIYKRLKDEGYPVDGMSDHGVSEALYLYDPDRNGIELYCDRPRKEWPLKHDGSIDMFTRPLDIDDLLSELHPESEIHKY